MNRSGKNWIAALGGALADVFGDPVPYLLAAALCAVTLLAARRGAAVPRPT